jgi:hypothetical protein
MVGEIEKARRETTQKRWQHYFRSPPTEIGAGTLIYLANVTNGGGQSNQTNGSAPHGAAAAAPPKGNGAAGGTSEIIEPVDLWDEMRAPPLPHGLLPRSIEDFAFVQGELMGCDPAGLAVGALTCCGVAIPDAVQIQPKKYDPHWLEGPRLWAGLIGPVSAMKSPMQRAVTRPIKRIDGELARAYTAAMEIHKQLSKDEKCGVPPPPHTRIRIEDATPESIQPILRDSPNGVLLERDELAAFFGGIEKYATGRGSTGATRGFFLQAYQGGPYNWDRVGRGSGHIPNLSISILGGIQPNVIYNIADTGNDDGLIQRLIPILLRNNDQDIDAPVPPATDVYEQLIECLHNTLSESFAPPLRFNDAALKVRERLAAKHLELVGAFVTLSSKFAAHIGKYNGIFARLCLIWHVIEHVDSPCNIIDAHTAERVAKFMHGFMLPHAQAFYLSLLGKAKEHERLLSLAGYILVHKPEYVTARDVQRGVFSLSRLDRQDIDTLLNYLHAYGWIDHCPAMYGGRPAPRWRVNPQVHTLFAQKAEQEKKRRAIIREKIRDSVKTRQEEKGKGDGYN